MFRSKNISDVSLMENKSKNDQHCEYDIGKSAEYNERCFGMWKHLDTKHV